MAANQNSFLTRWRSNFFTGLALVLPAVVSIWILLWLFTFALDKTDTLLLFLPMKWTHYRLPRGGWGPLYWYWSWLALVLTLIFICLVGRYGRNYIGRKAMEAVDRGLMTVPLLNKIYGTIKQVNESFHSNKSSFKQVVLVPFPHPRSYSLAFVTGEQTGLGTEKLISVFIPTTPNPTSGFLLLLPESEIRRLDLSVAEGIKFIISLGAIAPDAAGPSITGFPAESAALDRRPPPLP